VTYLGLESLCSLAGVAEFGVPVKKEVLAQALARFSTDRTTELPELLLRDVLDVALGNTDNHARNTSVSKLPNGRVALSPIYDFAPMILDTRGIARVCRWQDNSDYPDWSDVVRFLETLGLDGAMALRSLRRVAPYVEALPQMMAECRVPELVIDRCRDRIARVAKALHQVKA